ncbi:hydrogenase maturation protease [bacterium]|nr:hydrogenase maturation protease [bacterium]
MSTLTVIGIGNRLRGDDAIGPMVIDALRERHDTELKLVDAGNDALGILEYFDNQGSIMIVDACRMNKAPGTVLEFNASKAAMVLDMDPLSLHGLGLAEALQMAESLQMLPSELKIIGIEPDSIQFSGNLSPPVQRALIIATEKVQDELHRVAERIMT